MEQWLIQKIEKKVQQLVRLLALLWVAGITTVASYYAGAVISFIGVKTACIWTGMATGARTSVFVNTDPSANHLKLLVVIIQVS